MDAAAKRAAVVSALADGSQNEQWCSQPAGCRRLEAMSDAQLVGLCLPARAVRPGDWKMVSASKCHWGFGQLVACLPRPGAVFKYASTERGFTHVFDLRIPHIFFVGLVMTYLPNILGAFLCSATAFCGFLRPAKFWLASIWGFAGLMELYTSIALSSAQRSASSDLMPMDSFCWWPLSFSSLLMAWVIIFQERHLARALPLPFVFNMTALNVYNKVILGDMPIEVPMGSCLLFVLWLGFGVMRQVDLRQSVHSVRPDCVLYQADFKRLTESLEDAAAMRDLDDFTVLPDLAPCAL